MIDEKDAPEAEQATPDLDAAINAALDGLDEAPAEVESKGPARGPDGKFVSRATEGGDEPAAEEPAEVEAVTEEPEAEPEAVAKPQWTDGHFTGWKPEQRERFNRLTPEDQALFMERQAEQQAFFQRKLAETDEFKKVAEPLTRAAQEVEPFARSIGATPDVLLRNYAAIDQKLRFAPYQEKVALFADIAKEFGIPFTPPQADPLADPLSPMGEAYPVVHDLRSQLAALQAQVQQYKTLHETASQQQISQSIQSFASATDANGQPKYPYFDTVRATMGQLMASGKAASLEDAYAMAAKPIEDRIAADLAARQKAAQEKQQAAIAKARKAAPVKSSGIQPGGKTKGGDLNSILNSALDAHGIV